MSAATWGLPEPTSLQLRGSVARDIRAVRRVLLLLSEHADTRSGHVAAAVACTLATARRDVLASKRGRWLHGAKLLAASVTLLADLEAAAVFRFPSGTTALGVLERAAHDLCAALATPAPPESGVALRGAP